MKRFLSCALLALWATAANAQPSLVFASQARLHIGQAATVRGTVADAQIVNGNGFLFLDAPFPRNDVTVMVPTAYIGAIPSLEPYLGKLVDVVGIIQMNGTIPQVIVTRPDQITVQH